MNRPGFAGGSDLLNLGISSSTVFGSGFRPYQIELATASAVRGRTNIDLGGGATCGPKGKEVFCISQGVAGELDYTTSDVASQRNIAAKAQTNVTDLGPGAVGLFLELLKNHQWVLRVAILNCCENGRPSANR